MKWNREAVSILNYDKTFCMYIVFPFISFAYMHSKLSWAKISWFYDAKASIIN